MRCLLLSTIQDVIFIITSFLFSIPMFKSHLLYLSWPNHDLLFPFQIEQPTLNCLLSVVHFDCEWPHTFHPHLAMHNPIQVPIGHSLSEDNSNEYSLLLSSSLILTLIPSTLAVPIMLRQIPKFAKFIEEFHLCQADQWAQVDFASRSDNWLTLAELDPTGRLSILNGWFAIATAGLFAPKVRFFRLLSIRFRNEVIESRFCIFEASANRVQKILAFTVKSLLSL